MDQLASTDSKCEIKPAYVELSDDGQYLNISTVRMKENLNYMLEADPDIVKAAREEHQLQKSQKKNGHTNQSLLYDSFNDFPGLGQEESDYENDPDITCTIEKSSASCFIDDIQSITFGAFSSRFWALRKHINCMHDE